MYLGSNIIYNKSKCYNEQYFIKLSIVLKNIKHVLKNLNITVIQPINIKANTCRTVWVRDICINIDNKMYLLVNTHNVRRSFIEELKTLNIKGEILDNIYMEGGDIIQDGNTIYIGIGKRTDINAYKWLKQTFPKKKIIKIIHYARHLDCCFCVLPNNTIIYSKKYIKSFPSILRKTHTVKTVEEFIDKRTNPNLATNLLIINNTIIAIDLEKFHKFYDYLKSMGFNVILIPFYDVWKKGGGIRCITQWINKTNISIS